MKLIPGIRLFGVALSVVSIVLLLVHSFIWHMEMLRSDEANILLLVSLVLGVLIAVLAQKNMLKEDAFRFERSAEKRRSDRYERSQ